VEFSSFILGEDNNNTNAACDFKGSSLVSWLVIRGVVADRYEGEAFGRRLQAGQLIRRLDNGEVFRDSTTVYQLCDVPDAADT